MGVYEYNTILYHELMLKMEGFDQRLQNEEDIYRTVAFSAYIGSHLNPKKLPKNVKEFWPLKRDVATKKVTDEKRAAMREALKRMAKEKANMKEALDNLHQENGESGN